MAIATFSRPPCREKSIRKDSTIDSPLITLVSRRSAQKGCEVKGSVSIGGDHDAGLRYRVSFATAGPGERDIFRRMW